MTSYRGNRCLMAAACSMLMVGGSQSLPVFAQGGMLEEVVVVARKREESLQDTPVAVSAFNNSQMRAAQIKNIADLSQQVPGLSSRDGEKVGGLTIRGVGARSRGAKTDPGVGVYVDGIFMPRSDTQLVDVVDMESIQVLRGPQGTLFGKNTAGGALLLQSRKPDDVFSGNVEAGFGDDDRVDLAGRVSGPIIGGKLYGALTYDTRESDGYMDDAVTGKDYGNIDRQAVVGQLRWDASDTLTVDMIALWGEQDEHSAPTNCSMFNPDAQLNLFASTAMLGTYEEACRESEALVDDEKVLQDRTVDQQFSVTNYLTGITANWDLDAVSIRSITGYLYQEDLSRDHETDGTPFLSLSNYTETARHLNASGIDANNEERKFFSQEFNFFGTLFDDKLDYTLGLYYSDETIDDQPDGQTLTPGGWLGIPAGDNVVTVDPAVAGFAGVSLVNLTSESAAAFGQFIYNINDHWQLTLGGRYTWEEKKIDQINYVTTQGSLGLISREEYSDLRNFEQPLIVSPDVPRLKDDDSWTQASPSATITTFLEDGAFNGLFDTGMVYLTYSEGFKAGGFSDFGLDQPTTFDPEEVSNLELGFKLEMWDRRLRLNGAVYSMDYDEMQLAVTRTFGELDTKFGITNAGKAEMDGAELEVVILPLPELMISFTASYIDASYNEFVDEFVDGDGNTQLADRSDETFSYLPEQSYSWVIQYDLDTSFALFTPRVSGYYKDEIYLGQDPAAFAFESDATLDDYTVWNVRLAIEPYAIEGLEVSVFADNLGDEKYFGSGIVNASNLGAVSGIAGKPRNYGVDFYYYW
jgi:iron complex outermembrane receptor protein